ncbi:MAG TPA: hypothetical protein VIL01_12260 [Thermomicrobiales bacterium]
MNLFAGLSQTDYQDLLRAVGALIDERGWRDIRIWEIEGGLAVQGRPGADTGYETLLLSDDDLRALLEEAYRRRGWPYRQSPG